MASDVVKDRKKDPSSDLYAVNPCPPARKLPRKADFVCDADHSYYDVLKHRGLAAWAKASVLYTLTGPMDPGNDRVLFVRQSGLEKLDGVSFELQEGDLKLYDTDEQEHDCVVVAVGEGEGGPSARSVRWVLVRGLSL